MNTKEKIIRNSVAFVCGNHECNKVIHIKKAIIDIELEGIKSTTNKLSIEYNKKCFYIKCPDCGVYMFDCDPELVKSISTFNKKNYITECCCAANHYSSYKMPYILFYYDKYDYDYSNEILKEFKRVLSEIDKDNIVTLSDFKLYNSNDKRIKIHITKDYKNYLYSKEDTDKIKAEEIRLKWLALVEELANNVNTLKIEQK